MIQHLHSVTNNKYLVLAYSVVSTFVSTGRITMMKIGVIPVLKAILLQRAGDIESPVLLNVPEWGYYWFQDVRTSGNVLYSFSTKTLNHRILTLKEFLAQLMIQFQNSLSPLVYLSPSSRHCLNQQSAKTDPPPYLQFYFLPRMVTTTPTHLPTSSSARPEESSGLMVCCAFTLRLDQPSTLSGPHVEHNLSFLPQVIASLSYF